MIVLGYSDGVCSVFDPTDLESKIDIIKLKESEWILMPTSLPQHTDPEFEYPVGSPVLSLWHDTGRLDWTTEFYPAKVTERPSQLLEHGRVYSLSFGDAADMYVPQQFVLAFPPHWQ
jgi:hypothetical protein